MGVMIEGVWHAGEPKRTGKDGKFSRPETSFRNWITADGSPGPTGTGGFKAEAGVITFMSATHVRGRTGP